METRHIRFDPQDPQLQLIYERREQAPSGATLVGTVRLEKGAQVPAQGTSSHAADEYAFLLQGRVRMTSGGQTEEISAGTLMLIPAGEAHLVEAVEDAEILWWWVGDDREFPALKQQYPFAH